MKENSDKKQLIIIGIIVASVLFILTVVIFTVFGIEKGKKEAMDNVTPTISESEQDTNGADTETTAVFLQADIAAKKITVGDLLSGEQLQFDYSGGTQIFDKYEQLITVSQLEKGQVVKLSYIMDTKRLVRLSISGDIWENIGITDIIINKEANVISYHGKNYSYGKGTVIISEDKSINIDDVLPIDYLTIRGNEENIYSIVVTNGHGYLELEGGEAFLGGILNVGTQLMEQITENMRLTVKEGTHTVTINNKETEGSKEVVIQRNQTTICNVEEFGLVAVEYGAVQFSIFPEGASLFIDKEPETYVEPVSLTVGAHEVLVSLGGYVSYKGTLMVDAMKTTVTIILHENEAATTDNDTPNQHSENQDSENQDSENQDSENQDSENQDSGNQGGEPGTGGFNDSSESGQQTEDGGDNTSDDNQDSDTSKDTITIKWTTGASVFFNGEYVGVIEDGKLIVDKQVGKITVDLVIEGEDTITYDITVEDDGGDAVFSFPKR